MKLATWALALALTVVLASAVAWRWWSPRAQPVVAAEETPWQTLVPRGWDPTRRFRDAPLAQWADGSPQAQQLLQDMRDTWANAPTDAALDGLPVRLAGYVVPLQAVRGEMKEFLLVPYFGACIHVPPPPANQIVHVAAAQGTKGLRLMDAVWVSGTIRVQRRDSELGSSGYALAGASVQARTARRLPPALNPEPAP